MKLIFMLILLAVVSCTMIINSRDINISDDSNQGVEVNNGRL